MSSALIQGPQAYPTGVQGRWGLFTQCKQLGGGGDAAWL